MKRLLILAALAATVFSVQAQPNIDMSNPNFHVITLSNVPTRTSHSATNGNTNFSSQAIDPQGKNLRAWIKVTGTNATSSGTVAFSAFVAPDKTNYASAALATHTLTYNGTTPVIAQFDLPASNFNGVASLKYGAVTNVSTNFGTINWIKIGVPK